VESRLALLSADRFKFWNRCTLSEVVPKDGDVDVFGKSRYQTEGFRERRAASKKKPRMLGRQAVEQNIERPSDPEVFLDVLFGRAKASRGCEKNVAAVLLTALEELRKAGTHRARLAE